MFVHLFIHWFIPGHAGHRRWSGPGSGKLGDCLLGTCGGCCRGSLQTQSLVVRGGITSPGGGASSQEEDLGLGRRDWLWPLWWAWPRDIGEAYGGTGPGAHWPAGGQASGPLLPALINTRVLCAAAGLSQPDPVRATLAALAAPTPAKRSQSQSGWAGPPPCPRCPGSGSDLPGCPACLPLPVPVGSPGGGVRPTVSCTPGSMVGMQDEGVSPEPWGAARPLCGTSFRPAAPACARHSPLVLWALLAVPWPRAAGVSTHHVQPSLEVGMDVGVTSE